MSNINLAPKPYPLTPDFQEHGANIMEIATLYNCAPSEIIDFSSSINPLGPSKAAELAIIENIGNIANYPQDYTELTKALGDYLSVKQSNLFIDNGSASIIYKLFATFVFKNISILEPTFSEYEKAAKAYGCAIDIRERPDALFVCNPNNPTAKLIKKEEIESLARQASKTDTVLIIDEAFMDFVEDKEKYTAIDLVAEFPNLIVIGSLTKFFALAGLRIGYLYANETIIEKLSKVTPPWPINTLTVKAALASLLDTDYVQTSRAQIPQLRNNLIQELSKVKGVKAYDSQVNFILVEITGSEKSSYLYQELAERKIIIRDCASFGIGQKYMRLAVKLPSANKILAKNVKEVIKESTK